MTAAEVDKIRERIEAVETAGHGEVIIKIEKGCIVMVEMRVKYKMA